MKRVLGLALITMLLFSACSGPKEMNRIENQKLSGPSNAAIPTNVPNFEEFVPAVAGTSVISISAGGMHSMAIKEDHTLWAWGNNSFGQLGDDTTEGDHNGANKSAPVQIMNDVIAVSAGWYHTTAIKSDGSLWAWGNNDKGQLGDGTTVSRPAPVKVMEDVVSVSARNTHTLAIKKDGTLWAWGNNKECLLGDNTNENRLTPVKIMDNVVSVSAGRDYTMAIKKDGRFWIWGDDGYLQVASKEYVFSEGPLGGAEQHTPIEYPQFDE